jgi:hypothetical protein
VEDQTVTDDTPKQFGIYYADRELAHELGDPQLGVVSATSKAEAERLAWRDREILRRAMPTASLWAVEIRQSESERSR